MIDARDGPSAVTSADVLVIGDGVIGLSIALELARSGADCMVVGAQRPGVASIAAGGLLAPSLDPFGAPAQAFFDSSLALYPGFVQSLRDVAPDLHVVEGLLVVRGGESALVDAPAHELSTAETRALEPRLVAPHGTTIYPRDGSIDNERLTHALRAATMVALGSHGLRTDAVVSIEVRRDGIVATTESGSRLHARSTVLAAGAWTSTIAGLPRSIPVEPAKGQMIAIGATPLRHPVVGNGVYVVPRARETLVGSTLERAGYDTSTDWATAERLRAAAAALCPALGEADQVRAWAGLRPVTPDMLPIIGLDPDEPRIVYACGHSKNGILLAPATAVAVAALLAGTPGPYDLRPFSIERFVAD